MPYFADWFSASNTLQDSRLESLYCVCGQYLSAHSERVAEWLRHLTRKPKVRTTVGSNPMLDSLVVVRNTSPGRPEPCEGNLVAVAGSCGGLMVKHPWPLLEISLSDFRGLATLNINTYLPTGWYVAFNLSRIVGNKQRIYCLLFSTVNFPYSLTLAILTCMCKIKNFQSGQF